VLATGCRTARAISGVSACVCAYVCVCVCVWFFLTFKVTQPLVHFHAHKIASACHRGLTAAGLPRRALTLLDSLLSDLHQHTVTAIFSHAKKGASTRVSVCAVGHPSRFRSCSDPVAVLPLLCASDPLNRDLELADARDVGARGSLHPHSLRRFLHNDPSFC
jgi:hypothetical protein